MSYRANPKFLNQMQYCEDSGIPVAVVIGEDEISKNVVKIRNVATKAEVCTVNFTKVNCLFVTIFRFRFCATFV